MCILSYLPPNIPVDKDGLHNGGLNNPDGHGWAVITNDGSRILVGKSLNLDVALDGFIAARNEHMNRPALFHSRWATHGSTSIPNVHPFYVAGTQQTVVAHNGIITRKEATPGHGDDRSDTRKFADEVLLRQFKRLDRKSCLDALAEWVGGSNKLVILTVDPRYDYYAYLINSNRGQWDKKTGIWHSNSDYKWVTYRGYCSSGYEHWPSTVGKRPALTKSRPTVAVALPEDDETGGRCDFCQVGNYNELGYCSWCYTCIDCQEHKGQCQCYTAAAHDLAAVAEWEAGNDFRDFQWDADDNLIGVDPDVERWREDAPVE